MSWNSRGPKRPDNRGNGAMHKPVSFEATWRRSEHAAALRTDVIPPPLPRQSQAPSFNGARVEASISPMPKSPEQISEGHILFRMQPHQLPGAVFFYDEQGVRVERRAIKEDWHGAPVIVFPTNRGDSLIVGPSLKEEDRNRPEVCQDRAAFEYAKDGTLSAFAVGDGISEGAASASIADHLVRLTVDIFAKTRERIGPRRLSKSLVDGIVGLIQQQLRKRLDINVLVHDFLTTTKMVPRFSGRIVDRIRAGSVGATTLIAGMVQSGEFPETGGRGECVTMVQVGDGGYIVVGPYDRPNQSVFGEFAPPGSAPAQIAPGRPEHVPSGSIQVNYIFLRPGEMVIAVTDGIEKGVWRTLQAFRGRAQELFRAGYTDPNQLLRRLLWEANGGAVTWADDITMFAHKAQ